ncbi:receptor-type tyrosine-protein phosphatase eta isoform X3 [Marmota marmota marmota]|uniref:receptor-type tyrosine-protein phosphatase eta isoform X3 n=1 Tax=Marmota marmota marmota TaxID=9994 RepID=UPI00209357D7|nr:receptor-type tyrosine-protein phosphatase eta isoform X3 [Marmota marmota marmota]
MNLLTSVFFFFFLLQIVCSGDAPGSVSETDLALSSNDSQSSRIPPGQENTGELKSEDTTSQSITIGNLSPGTSYLSGTEGTSKTVDSRTAPSPVFGIHAVSISPTSVVLTWKNDDTAASEYTYAVKNERDNEWRMIVTNETECIITGLSPGTSYEFSITPGIANETWGSPMSQTVTTAPSPVFGIDADSISPTSMVLTWKINDTAASEYTYAVKNERDNKWSLIVTNKTECTITGLSPGTSYEFSITPGIANETWGSPMSKTVTTAPSPVFGIDAVSISPTSVFLTWKNNDSAASEYTYAVKNERDNKWRMIVTNETEYTITGLSPGTSYEFSITPGIANETRGSPMSKTVTTAPSPVFDIDAVSISPTSVVLSWKNNDTAASEYTYAVKNERDNEWRMIVTNETECTITGLSPGSSYKFSITPGIGNATLGTPMSKTVTTEPRPVSGLRVTFMGVTLLALTWIKDNGTESYQILLETSGSQTEMTRDLAINISVLKPGFPLRPESNETQGDTLDASNTGKEVSTHQPCSSPLGPVTAYCRVSADPSSGQDSQHIDVLLIGLKSNTQYKATVYSQAADGTKGQPQLIEFRTNSNQVSDLKAVNVSATSITLTWKAIYNGSSSAYSYKIQVAGEASFLNFTVRETHAMVSGLNSSTLYNITVWPFLGNAEGTPGFLQVYTPPGPVSDFRVTNVGVREIGLAWSSDDSQSFRILTVQEKTGELKNDIATNQSITIGNLSPGTSYRFEIFPQGPNGTEGTPRTVDSRTDTSAVFDIRVVRVTTTEMQLEWQNTDGAAEYTYHLVVWSENYIREQNISGKAITLWDLNPGTLYNISVSLDAVQGYPSSIVQYTRPSNVSNMTIKTTSTAATLHWWNQDAASSTYSYRLLIEKADNSSNTTQVVRTNVGVTNATVGDLMPGSHYRVEIFAQVGNDTESLPFLESFCTEPAPLASFHCEVVPKEPALVLKWACPPGTNEGFMLEVSSGAWDNVTYLESCTSENGTEYRKEVTYLNFSTSYNFSITTLSCGKKALATQNTCVTGITDPPPPDGSPNITSVSHNSVKVKFSGFEASHGPIKAYAVILTTGEADNPSADVLKYTYKDFKNGASNTYVTYFISTEEKGRSQGLSEVLKYEINVGNESTTHGYYNGKLEPLGSYRACVAGFTNITFNLQSDGLINGAESYVTFGPYSEAVFLPQDPGVICGAVFGCIFGALVIVAVGGFIFWRKKRKDAKNNEVSFSQIKPKKSKLIRVENFEAYFKKQQADSNCGFAEEYEDLKLVGISLPKYAAELAENRGKNRYNNVLPYDVSRVKLSVQTHSTDDYVNANYMPGYHSKREFIATQGPLPNTLKDFWRMVWEKNVYAIVMLTKCVEQGRTKCEEYWPSKQAQDYGDITVAMTSEIVLPEWTIRDFTVKNIQTSESHPLRQFHFTSWPDHGVPDTTDLLINFRYLVRDYMKQSPPESPILVHCSAGVGRTGTFIAIDRLIYQIENENTVDVYGIVYDLRMHRPLMVQTEDQYVFLNQCVLDIIRSQKDSKVNLIYQNMTAMTIYENLEPVSMFGKTNGYIA